MLSELKKSAKTLYINGLHHDKTTALLWGGGKKLYHMCSSARRQKTLCQMWKPLLRLQITELCMNNSAAASKIIILPDSFIQKKKEKKRKADILQCLKNNHFTRMFYLEKKNSHQSRRHIFTERLYASSY